MAESSHQVAPAAVQRRMYVTLTRKGSEPLHLLVGGGTVRERIASARAILAWNREGRALNPDFPKDAPIHLWQVNWPSVFKKGNV